MANKHHLIHLDDICKEFNIILLDTSVVESSFEIKNYHSNQLIKRIIYKKSEQDLCNFLNKYHKRTMKFFITYLVHNELKIKEDNKKSLNKKKNNYIKTILNKYEHLKISKKEHEYFNNICSAKKEIKALLKSLKKKKKIITPNNFEKINYDNIFKTNFKLKLEHKLTDTDYDILITGAVLSKTRGKTALFSNDTPLLRSYKSLVYKEGLKPVNYSFFKRDKKEFFSRVVFNFE